MRLPPPGNRTSAITESGLLSAVGVVLYLCWYVPVLYLLSVTLTPMPLTVLTYRYGARIGLAGLACTSVALTAILGPSDAFIYFGLFGVIGFITGWLLHRNLSPGRVLLLGSVLVCAYDVAGYYVIERALGLEDSLKPVKESFLGGVDYMVTNAPPELSPMFKQMRKDAEDLFVLPLALFFGAAFIAFVANYVIALVVLRQLGIEMAMPPGLLFFRLPALAGVASMLFIMFGAAARGSPSLAVRVSYLNAEMLVKTMLGAEALSLVLCVLNMTRMAVPARMAALLASLLLFPLWWLVGVADSLFDLRAVAVLLLA